MLLHDQNSRIERDAGGRAEKALPSRESCSRARSLLMGAQGIRCISMVSIPGGQELGADSCRVLQYATIVYHRFSVGAKT